MKPLADDPPRFRWEARLAVLLSVIAGFVDVTGFLTLGNIFAAHITGNVVMATAAMFREIRPAQALAIPVFMLAVAATWMIAKASARKGAPLAWLLLAIQFVLLTIVWIFCIATAPSSEPQGLVAGVAAMLAVSAMACQHALLRLVFRNAPPTAVMTGNITNMVLSVFETRAASGPVMEDGAHRLVNSIYALVSFIAGCIAGAVSVHVLGDGAWAIPAALAAVAVALR